MAFAVARRTREIGIRMAIGATPGQIAWLIGRRAAWLVGSSTLAGAVLSLLIAGLLSPVLLGVSPWAPEVHLAGLVVMALIALAGLLAAGASGGDAGSECVVAAGLAL